MMEKSKWRRMWEKIRSAPARPPIARAIPGTQTDIGRQGRTRFERDAHYFSVIVNELFLKSGSEWLTNYDPAVFVVSEFTYHRKKQIIPFVVGPALLEQFVKQIPEGMLFRNTRVAGIHPYRGGIFALSIVLCRFRRKDFAREILHLVEKTAGALDFSTALGTYTKLSGIILDGVDSLLGREESKPLAGLRTEFDPTRTSPFSPGYFVLIDAPETSMEIDKLWVRGDKLFYGSTAADAVPFREANYVLYSIETAESREDESLLPFYGQYEQVLKAASLGTERAWKSAKARMHTLYQALIFSPDLIPEQANRLCDQYVEQMKAVYNKARMFTRLESGTLGGELETVKGVRGGFLGPGREDSSAGEFRSLKEKAGLKPSAADQENLEFNENADGLFPKDRSRMDASFDILDL